MSIFVQERVARIEERIGLAASGLPVVENGEVEALQDVLNGRKSDKSEDGRLVREGGMLGIGVEACVELEGVTRETDGRIARRVGCVGKNVDRSSSLLLILSRVDKTCTCSFRCTISVFVVI